MDDIKMNIDSSNADSVTSSTQLQNEGETTLVSMNEEPKSDGSDISNLSDHFYTILHTFSTATDIATDAMQESCDWIVSRTHDPSIDSATLEAEQEENSGDREVKSMIKLETMKLEKDLRKACNMLAKALNKEMYRAAIVSDQNYRLKRHLARKRNLHNRVEKRRKSTSPKLDKFIISTLNEYTSDRIASSGPTSWPQDEEYFPAQPPTSPQTPPKDELLTQLEQDQPPLPDPASHSQIAEPKATRFVQTRESVM